MNRIEKIIKKAECIRDYLKEQNKDVRDIVQHIKDLNDYWVKYGDLPAQKYFYIIVCEDLRNHDMAKELPVFFDKFDFHYHTMTKTIVVKSSEFTVHIKDILLGHIKKSCARVYSMPPAVIDYDIADTVWDIESTKIEDVELTGKLIAAGFKPTTNNIKFAGDFEI